MHTVYSAKRGMGNSSLKEFLDKKSIREKK